MYEEKFGRQLHKNAASNIKQVMDAAPNKAAAVQPPTTHHENYRYLTKLDKPNMQDTVGEVMISS